MAPDESLHEVWEELGKRGNENTPISWQEIKAYLQLTESGITPEETRILREMSEVYCNELRNLSAFAKAPVDKVDTYD